MAESMKEMIREETIIAHILMILNKKWLSIDDYSRTLLPLFECFESVVTAMGVFI